MSGVTRWTMALVIATAVVACGDPLVDGAYRGQALLSLEGPVLVPDSFALDGVDGDPTATVRLAVFWAANPYDPDRDFDAVSGVEQAVEVTQASVLRYSMTLFSPPPQGVLSRPFLGTGEVALGQVIAYADLDGSGGWSPTDDVLLGGVENIVVAYTPSGATGPMFAEEGLAPGFHRLHAVQECHPDFKVRPLAPLGPNDDLRLVILLTGAVGVYVDLNCDGAGNEWLPSNCPADIEELDLLCAMMSPDGVQVHAEFCDFCAGLGPLDACEPQLGECGDQWPELCEPYQQCLDPAWLPDPHVQCDFEFITCLENGPASVEFQGVCEQGFQTCLLLAECQWLFRNCLQDGQPEPVCLDAQQQCQDASLPGGPEAPR